MIRADGTVVRIERSARATSGHGHRTFIVDASQVRGVITELELAVTETNHEFVLALAVDTGAMLDAWQPLVRSHQIAALEFQGQTLIQSKIPLPKNAQRYLRIRVLDEFQSLEFSSVRAKITSRNAGRTEYQQFRIAPLRSLNSISVDLFL